MSPKEGLPAVADRDPSPEGIGLRIRQSRQRLGLTLGQLSEASGVSIGALSQIERGLVSPTVRTLYTIAGVLRMPPAQLIDPAGYDLTIGSGLYVLRAADQKVVIDAGGVTKLLASPATIQTMKCFVVTVQPGGTTGAEAYSHPGEELGYVISGRFVLEVEGVAYQVKAGDGFALPSTLRHRFYNTSDSEARILWVNKAR
ncbi:cupin domain-containing protein [Paenirhodobacter sp.]|uniref:cupin domain-containing protein n=1 Tax=Paenirhodobacter sp. TaxID=1965326 RepID=UPI003B41AC01